MSSFNAAKRIDLPTADQMAASAAIKATEDFANSPAMKILREWSVSPEIKSIEQQAEEVKAAAARAGK